MLSKVIVNLVAVDTYYTVTVPTTYTVAVPDPVVYYYVTPVEVRSKLGVALMFLMFIMCC